MRRAARTWERRHFLSSATQPANRGLRGFARDERGAVAAIFAIVFAAILLAMAVSLDFAVGTAEQTREQQALDAATLAASDQLGMPNQDTDGPAAARAYFQENLGGRSNATLASVTLDTSAGEVRATSHGTVVSRFMRVFGADDLRIGASSTVAKGDQTFEIALVLDNSGSMAGSYIADLKTAAKNLTGIMFAGAEGTQKVKIGVVPFAGAVNVGASHRTSSWMDTNAASSMQYENVSENRTRFQLFDDMGVAWGGCVEVRPGALAVDDTSPNASNADSFFVPMLAPDEPDSENDGGNNYSNNYLVDDGGICPPQPLICTRTRNGVCKQWAKTPLTPQVAQARTCKYKAQPSGSGPNAYCTTKPILALSTNRTAIDAHIDTLVASGSTNISEGLTWGWRILSPGEPFAEGRAYATPKNNKIIILMTDGENTYYSTDNHNKSTYGAYGYTVKNRLGATYTDTAIRHQMDVNLQTACHNAKTAGVMVYTIAFRLESDPNTQAMLRDCATTPDKFFAASNGTVLIMAFQQIARQLNQLRVTG